MEFRLLVIGKNHFRFIDDGLEEYLKRLRRYLTFSVKYLPDVKGGKNFTEEMQKSKEGELILSSLSQGDMLIILDEKGKDYTSREFASYIDKLRGSGRRCITFCIGGPYGFSKDVYSRADGKISLSRMTFNHEMVRLFFTEQIYRAFTILSGSPYHHE